jgi:hypothetical protein
MVKRTLIAIAVVALLATSSQAAIEVYTNAGGLNGDLGKGAIKTEGTESAMWPFEYKALDLCSIPIEMKIGYYVSVHECHKRKIKLVQVDCGDIGKGSGDWPCYSDCESVTVKANFDVKLGLKLANLSNIIKDKRAYFKGDFNGNADAGSTTFEVCVDAWKTRLENSAGSAGSWESVGNLIITVKPRV